MSGTKQEAQHKQTVIITVYRGLVEEVKGLPPGYGYAVIDKEGIDGGDD